MPKTFQAFIRGIRIFITLKKSADFHIVYQYDNAFIIYFREHIIDRPRGSNRYVFREQSPFVYGQDRDY